MTWNRSKEGECRIRGPAFLTLLLPIVLCILHGGIAVGANIDPQADGSGFAYGENVGWVNFRPSGSDGVTVSGTALTGFAWGEDIGWINLSPTTGGVLNDGAGRISGFAWGENVGWINFGPLGQGVTIDSCGDFAGKAWGENVGWISFRSDDGAPFPFKLTTSWLPPDIVPPATSALSTGSGWQKTDVGVTLAATDNACGSGVKEIRYQLDMNPEVPYVGPLTIAAEGIHTLHYHAIDNANNLEAVNSLTVQIDKTPPVLSLSLPGDGATYFINQAVQASYTATDSLSGLASVTGTVPSGSGISTGTPGSMPFTISATDAAGNTGSASFTYSVIYPGNIGDTATPAPALAWGENVGWVNFKPSFGPGVTVTAAAVTGRAWGENIGWITLGPFTNSVAQDGAGNLSGYAWAENAGWINFNGVTIDAATGAFKGAAWGENVGWITFDLAANGTGTSWRPDTAPPDTLLTETPPTLTASASASFGFTATEAGSSFACQLDAGPWEACTSPKAYTGLADGSHTFHVQATDAGGSLDPTPASHTWTVDTTPPEITITSPASGAVFALHQVVGAGYGCTDLSGVTTCTGPVPSGSTIDTGSAGAKSFTVTATDGAGNTASKSTTYSVLNTYTFAGFYRPVDNPPALNSANAGQAIPLKFTLGGNFGLNILWAGYPISRRIACDTMLPVDALVVQAQTPGAKSLTYDASLDRYAYVWKTEKSWGGTCRQLVLRLNDGTDHILQFQFKK